MAIDASLIEADSNKQNSTPKEEWDAESIDPEDAPRAVREYLDTLDEAAFGAASEVQPKFTSRSDPASQWTAAHEGPAFFSYSDNYLIDTDHGVIFDVEATRSILQAEIGSTKTMLNRVKERFDLHPEQLIADTAYGTGPLLGWLVDRKIAPHVPVFDKAGRSDDTWSRADFEWDAEKDQWICPDGHALKQFDCNCSDPNRGPTAKGTARYRALKEVRQVYPSKAKCCPNADARKITREETEHARQVARDIAKTRQYDISIKLRKKVEMLFTHVKRILGLGRLRLRDPCGASDEFLLAATTQNLHRTAKTFSAPQQTHKARSERRCRSVECATFCTCNTLFFQRIGGKRTFAAGASKLGRRSKSGHLIAGRSGGYVPWRRGSFEFRFTNAERPVVGRWLFSVTRT